MSTKPSDDILGAVRKKGAFFFNPHSPSQRVYYSHIKELEAAGVVAVDRADKKRWVCSAGAVWNRRA